jgi:hypothetical protein
VSVTAVVRDRKGRFVRDLERTDFTVLEAVETRPLLDVRVETDGPIRIALLVDVSGSMRCPVGRWMPGSPRARLFRALARVTKAALYVFDTQLERVTGFTSDIAA